MGDAFLRILVNTKNLVEGMTQAKQITEQATTEIGSQWEHFFGTLEQGHGEAAQVVASSTEDMQTNWLGVAAAYGAVAAAGTMLIKQIATTAMRTQELGIVAGITAKNMGISNQTVNEQVEALKKLGMTTQAASTLTTQFMRSELDLADASKLARAAQNLAIVAMQDSSQAAMTMTRAITMQRPILLRQYGIIGGLSDAYDAMGKELGILGFRVDSSGKSLRVWSRELTTAEKRQSIFNMIMEQSSGLAGAYEAAMDAPGKAMRSFGRHVMSAQEAVGEYWLPAMDKAVKIATAFIKAFVDAPKIVHQLAGALLVGVTVVAAITAAIIAKSIAMTVLAGTIMGASISLGAFTVSLAAATLGLSLIVAAIVMLGIKLHEHSKNMETARQEAFASSDTYAEYARKMEEAGASAHALSEDMWELAKAEKDATDAQRILLESADYETYVQAMKDAGLGAEALAEGIWEAEKAQAALLGTTSKSTTEIEKEAQARGGLLKELSQYKDMQIEVATETKKGYVDVAEGMEAYSKQGAEISKALSESAIARGEEVAQLVLQDEALREVALAQGLVTQAQVDSVEAIEASDRAMLLFAASTQEMRVQTGFYIEALTGIAQEAVKTSLELENAAIGAAETWGAVTEDMTARGKEMSANIRKAVEEARLAFIASFAEIGAAVSEGYSKLIALTEGYQSTVVQLESELAIQRVAVAEQSAAILGQIEAAYQDSVRQLMSSGRAEELAQLTQTSGQVLSLLEASYRSQVAAVEAATREQLALAERANAERWVAAAAAYQQELAELQKFIGNKLMMWTQLHAEELKGIGVYDKMLEAVQTSFDGQLSIADQFTIKYQELMTAMAEGNTDAIATIIADIQGLGDAIETEMGMAADDMVTAQEKMTEAAEAGWAEIHSVTASALSDLASIMQDYQTNILATWDSYNASVESAALSRQISLREGEINYQRSRQELIAKANAEINAMEAAGLDEKAANRKAKLDEDLTMLEYNYDTQKAWAAWHWEIQQLMQEQAHYLRLAETAEFAKKEAEIVLAQAEAKLSALEAELAGAVAWTRQKILLSAAVVDASVDSAKGEIGALQAVIEARKAAMASWDADLSGHLAKVDKISADIQALIAEGPQLPEMPDFSQWVDDFSGGMAKSGASMGSSAKETSVSVTKTLKEAIIDIADGFSAAMQIFSEVAEYETPTGLAAGMKMLREDIEEAVRQMYKAYQEIGEDGVKGAKLIAEAAQEVTSVISGALEAFSLLPEYSRVGREKIYELGDDIFDAMDLMLTIGARFNQLGHDYRDVMKVAKQVSDGILAAVGWIKTGVEAFAALKDYASPAKASIDALITDLQMIMSKLVEISTGEIDQAKLAWAEFAASLLSTVAGMIGDMETLAAFKGDLDISWRAVQGLVTDIADTVQDITWVIGSLDFSGTLPPIDQFALDWLAFTSSLISTVVGMIADMETLAAFEGGLFIGQAAVENLVEELSSVVGYIVEAFTSIGDAPIDAVYQALIDKLDDWIIENGRLITSLTGVIGDLHALAAFEGDLQVTYDIVKNLMDNLWATTFLIAYVAEGFGGAQIDKAYQALIDKLDTWIIQNGRLVTSLAALIEDIATLANFEGGLQVTYDMVKNLMDNLWATTFLIAFAAEGFGGVHIDEAYRALIDELDAWITENGRLITALANVIEDLKTLAAFEGGLTVSTANVTNLMEALDKAMETILTAVGDVSDKFDKGGLKVEYEMQAAWLEFNTKLVSTMASIVDDIEKLSAFESVDEAEFKISLDSLFDALYWFLDEFHRRVDLFAGVVSAEGAAIAEQMGKIVGSLGATVQSLLDVAEFAVTPAEAETAIGLFFGALELFLTKFKEKAVDFQNKVDQDIADLATVIETTVSGIGGAVEPLINILEYNPEVRDIEAKIVEFFEHLQGVLTWIEYYKDYWVVSDAALKISERVDEMMGYLSTAVSTLSSFADYGEENILNAITGFLVFWRDLGIIVQVINDSELITQDAIDAASAFMQNCIDVVDIVKAGMDKLNSLQYLPTDTSNLVEAGNNLVISLSDGFVQRASAEWARIEMAVSGGVGQIIDFIDLVLNPYVEDSGYGLGVAFIQGWIDGLANNVGALYAAIETIVQNAIAAAEAAAGIASRSQVMFDFGNQMTAGLIEGLQAQQSGVLNALTEMLAAPDLVLSPQMAGAGGGDTYQYAYNEAEGGGADRHASLRQQFELLEFERRLRR